MKAFIFSVILFLIILSIVIINSLYIHDFCKEIRDVSDAAHIDIKERASLLCDKWNSCRSILTFSIHEEDIEKMDEFTQGLKSAAESDDRAEIEKYLFLIKRLTASFQKNEEPSLQGIG